MLISHTSYAIFAPLVVVGTVGLKVRESLVALVGVDSRCSSVLFCSLVVLLVSLDSVEDTSNDEKIVSMKVKRMALTVESLTELEC
jgi:hypothetical protein